MGCKKIIENCDCTLIDNTVDNINTFDYDWYDSLQILPHSYGETRAAKRVDYIDAICALDIETSNLDDIEQSLCYIWQFCINGHCVIGRDLKQLKIFFDRLSLYCDHRTRLVVYIHNEGFEFHHIREVLEFEQVFSVAPREPIKALYKNIEFRCSYVLTNNKLSTFLDNMRVENRKSTMSFKKLRFPWSKLNKKEMVYCLNDVIGLVQAIDVLMKSNGDTLYTIPLTSTGYTRRDVKAAMVKRRKKADFKRAIPDYNTFKQLNQAFRGGNTHANRWIVGHVIEAEDYGLIHSYDRVSSYPDSLINKLYPWELKPTDTNVETLLEEGKAVLCDVVFSGIRLKDPFNGCPYIPVSKCRGLINAQEDNGRVISANKLTMSCTDLDLKIILDSYTFDRDPFYFNVKESDYKPLPVELKSLIIHYFQRKTALKNVDDKELEYQKFKNRFNAIYGLMVQSPAKLLIEFSEDFPDLFETSREKTLKQVYNENIRKTYLLYQWGVWCCAWARYELERLIQIVQNTEGATFLYCDTDSVKFTGSVDFSVYNEEHKQLSIKNGGFAKDPSGEVHYLGVVEQEHEMIKFLTHGAKKYAYVCREKIKKGKRKGCYTDVLHLTCAGVNKEKGAKELGSIYNFMPETYYRQGFVFRKSAGVEAKYNDHPKVRNYHSGRYNAYIYSNIYLKDSTYTLSYAPKYTVMLRNLCGQIKV